ncbi:MAG: PAS domain-containing sensor histidine kinase [Alphaproteobacteria bacterium]|nr:PAS domain-containing sensor histidine kinase [Alphaproteobacteria bacterium]
MPIVTANLTLSHHLPLGLFTLAFFTWTLRREAEKAMTGQFDQQANRLGSLALRCDGSGSVSAVSANCEALFGLPASALLGRGFFERVQVADRPAFLQTISDARRELRDIKTALRWRASWPSGPGSFPEPVFRWLEMRSCLYAEFCSAPAGLAQQEGFGKPAAEPQEIVFLFHDVTQDRRGAVQSVEMSEAAIEEPDGDDLLAEAMHELRTPLNAIVGFSELLGNPRLAPLELEKQREYASIINRSGIHLLAVVNAILHLSRIKSEGLLIEPSTFSVASLIDQCCDMVKLHARKKGVELLRVAPKNLEPITTDKRVFTQILINLLSNAIKFTPAKGSVTISVKAEAQSLVIRVADTGIGISSNDLSQLGAPFFQAKTCLERSGKGTGLGLSIVRGFVGRLGGSIRLASEPGKGTCVMVSLPLDCRDLKVNPRTPAKIETLAFLARPDQPDLCSQMMVKKIA